VAAGWVWSTKPKSHEERAKELREVFEKSGYNGVMKTFAKDFDAARDYYYAAGYHAMLGDKDAAFAAFWQSSR
jgi:hypothetical protein